MGTLLIQEEPYLVNVSTRSVKDAKVIRTGYYVIIRFKDGSFAITRIIKTERFAHLFNASDWQIGLIDAMVKLKVMTPERRKELMDKYLERRRAQDREHDRQTLKALLKRYTKKEFTALLRSDK